MQAFFIWADKCTPYEANALKSPAILFPPWPNEFCNLLWRAAEYSIAWKQVNQSLVASID